MARPRTQVDGHRDGERLAVGGGERDGPRHDHLVVRGKHGVGGWQHSAPPQRRLHNSIPAQSHNVGNGDNRTTKARCNGLSGCAILPMNPVRSRVHAWLNHWIYVAICSASLTASHSWAIPRTSTQVRPMKRSLQAFPAHGIVKNQRVRAYTVACGRYACSLHSSGLQSQESAAGTPARRACPAFRPKGSTMTRTPSSCFSVLTAAHEINLETSRPTVRALSEH